jgi:predicted nucleotidyltransferase
MTDVCHFSFEHSMLESNGALDMIDLITNNLDAVGELCRRYGVRKLEVFGSAATGEFDLETSDIDLIYEFSDLSSGLVDRFLAFAEGLEEIFGRRIDLIPNREFTNPYFRYSVNKSRATIYEFEGREAAA